MKFEKFLFGASLNGLDIEKYTDGDKVFIKTNNDANFDSLTFESGAEYESWHDSIHDNNGFYLHHGDAQLVQIVANQLRKN